MDTRVLPIIILLPLILGTIVVLWLKQFSRGVTALGAIGVSLSSFILLLTQAKTVLSGQAVLEQWQWLPQIGIDFSFRLDALSLIFSLLITGIGTLIYIYAYYYLNPKNSLSKLYALLMLFMAAMLGISLSNNLIILLVFWELTSISSFLLVGYWSNYDAAQRGARMALTITGMGGLAMLGGFILIGQIAGTYQIDQLTMMASTIQNSGLFVPALLLILLGAFTKSAQFPFHFWLPNAMAAPTPVSAYLHSATMVKAGIFLVARLLPIFVGSALFHNLVTTIGLLTLCMLKKALAKITPIEQADYVISTAHKAKGLEWNRVHIEDDYQFKINGLEHKISDEELRLLYVACTRAKVSLNIHHIYDLVQQLKVKAPFKNKATA